MRRKPRGPIEIYVDILRVIGSGASKNHIVYKANLNFVRCERYLSAMLESELIMNQSHPTQIFFVTAKGQKFIKEYQELKALL